MNPPLASAPMPPETPLPPLQVLNVSRAYGDLMAVDDVSLRVGPGEIVGLVGPNGAGKTTLLRCIVGLLRPASGAILVDGHDIEQDPGAAKRAAGFVPDVPDLFEYLSTADHLEFVARLYGRAGAGPHIEALRRDLALDEVADALPEQLSAGMKQRLALACALVPDPRLLVLDEPLTNVDPRGARTIKDQLRTRAAAGMGVLLSSHMLPLIEELAHRVIVMDRGRVRYDGTLADARARLADPAAGLEEFFLTITEPGPSTAGG